jgi:hypothetical protein
MSNDAGGAPRHVVKSVIRAALSLTRIKSCSGWVWYLFSSCPPRLV